MSGPKRDASEAPVIDLTTDDSDVEEVVLQPKTPHKSANADSPSTATPTQKIISSLLAPQPRPIPVPRAIPLPKPTQQTIHLDNQNTLLLFLNLPTMLTATTLLDSLAHAKWNYKESDPRWTRRNCNIGDAGFKYQIQFRASTKTHSVEAWSKFPTITRLREVVNDLVKPARPFQYAVVQHYRDQKAEITKHMDLENDPDAPICGVSFGQTRTLVMGRNGRKVEIELPDRWVVPSCRAFVRSFARPTPDLPFQPTAPSTLSPATPTSPGHTRSHPKRETRPAGSGSRLLFVARRRAMF